MPNKVGKLLVIRRPPQPSHHVIVPRRGRQASHRRRRAGAAAAAFRTEQQRTAPSEDEQLAAGGAALAATAAAGGGGPAALRPAFTRVDHQRRRFILRLPHRRLAFIPHWAEFRSTQPTAVGCDLLVYRSDVAADAVVGYRDDVSLEVGADVEVAGRAEDPALHHVQDHQLKVPAK